MPATQEMLQQVAGQTLDNIRDMLMQGLKEYANSVNVLQNFEDIAQEVGISREQVLYTYFKKHLDGIKNYMKGVVSQREDVEGRIIDAMVYLVLFRLMVQEKKGNFLVKQAETDSVRATMARSEAYSDGHPRPVVETGRVTAMTGEATVSSLKDG